MSEHFTDEEIMNENLYNISFQLKRLADIIEEIGKGLLNEKKQ